MHICIYHGLKSNSKIPENLRNICRGELGYGECYIVLKTFQKNKSLGIECLTVEFHIARFGLEHCLLTV